ncbi:hypothetical protein GE21DRAFT_1213879, partial [Neurospora crassa]
DLSDCPLTTMKRPGVGMAVKAFLETNCYYYPKPNPWKGYIYLPTLVGCTCYCTFCQRFV